MYVEKRGNKYRFVERYKINGETKRVSVTLDRDTPQSRRKAAELLEAKKMIPSKGMTYSELVEAYIKYQSATLKMSTWKRNEASLKRLDFGKGKVEDMTAGFISSRLLDKTTKPGTYNEYLKRVKAMFRWAYQNDYISSSDCVDKIKPMKDDRKSRIANKYLETDELKKVLASASDYYRNVFEFLALSGLRIGELIALDDADVGKTEISVTKTYDFRNGIMNTPKTAAGNRTVHIQPELAKCIWRIRAESNQNRLVSGHRVPYFVVSPYGGRLSYEKTNRVFKSLCESLTGKPLTLHALRHTHVALMAASGADLEAIARRIGHESTKITKEIYYHVTDSQKKKDDATFDAITILA